MHCCARPAARLALLAVRLALLGSGRVVVQALRHEVHGQRVLVARRLLDLGSLVLEPDLDLRLVEAQLLRQALAPLLRQVPVGLELRLEPLQLFRRESRARPLVLFVRVLLLWFAGPGTWAGKVDGKNTGHSRPRLTSARELSHPPLGAQAPDGK